MPRLVNSNPSYRKHRASGQAVVSIEGRDFYLGPWNSKSSKAEYDRLVSEWLAAGRRLPGSQLPDISIAELIERFWDHVQLWYRHPDGTPTSEVRSYKLPLGILNRLYGETRAEDFGPLALESVRNEMIDKNWKRKSINQHIGRLKRLFKWAVAKQLVLPSVWQALTAVSGYRSRPSRLRLVSRTRFTLRCDLKDFRERVHGNTETIWCVGSNTDLDR